MSIDFKLDFTCFTFIFDNFLDKDYIDAVLEVKGIREFPRKFPRRGCVGVGVLGWAFRSGYSAWRQGTEVI